MDTGGFFLVQGLMEHQAFGPEQFSEMQVEFGKAAEDFALQEILPRKGEIEQFNPDLTRQLMKQCGELGLLGVDVPEQYGGLDLDKVTSALLAERITLGESASFTVTFSAHTGIGTLPIVYFGNEKQKEFYLPKLASGEWISSYALTEPGAGSDALAIRTIARLSEDGQYYILNGNKQFISNGGWANLLITFAKIDGDKLTAFLIDPTSEGVIRKEEKNKLGLHGSSTCNVILENVKVPVENVLGTIGDGAAIAFNSLDIGRFKLGASVLGGCKTTLREAIPYALERRQFGQPIAYFDAIRKKFADMLIRTFALESIVYETAHLLDESIATVQPDSPTYSTEVAHAIERYAIECSVCKIYGSEALWQNADDGLQIFGGYGYIEDYPMAQILRDTRIDRIYEGTNEINRQIITGYLMKKTLLEELPLREKMKETEAVLAGKMPPLPDWELGEEERAVELAKHLLLIIYRYALTEFGQDLQHEQQVGEIISDAVSDIFIMQTTLSRIRQYNGPDSLRHYLLAIGKVLVAETTLRMHQNAYLALHHILPENNRSEALKQWQYLGNAMLLSTDTMKLKQELAELLYRTKDYPYHRI